MNRDSAAKLWPVMKDFAEGKDVQFFGLDKIWTYTRDPNFYTDIKYRLKPEPKEVWVNEYEGGEIYAYTTKEQADVRASSDRLSCTHYIEVMKD